MKKIIAFVVVMLSVTTVVTAQPGGHGDRMKGARENIEVLKVAYFTKHLSLTTEEAEKFWPMYNAYTAEVRKARQENQEDILAFEESVLNIRKKYKTDLKKVLNTDERVNKALVAEREFMNVVRKELQQRVEKRRKNMPERKEGTR